MLVVVSLVVLGVKLVWVGGGVGGAFGFCALCNVGFGGGFGFVPVGGFDLCDFCIFLFLL